MREHVVVVGGSVAGLVAARVLSGHFERVTIVERDTFPGAPRLRPGIPQAKHTHLLLARGLELLLQLFPGLEHELDAACVPRVDWLNDCWVHAGRGFTPRRSSDLLVRMATREYWEWVIRGRVLADPRVRLLAAHEVVELRHRSGAIDGVRLRPRRDAVDPTDELRADLVVDASGRDSRTPDWLSALGYEVPKEIVVDAKVGYASQRFRGVDDVPWKVLWIRGGEKLRTGIMARVEEGWIVTLVGLGGDYPPVQSEGFLEFARSLPTPELIRALERAEPVSSIAGYRRTASRMRRYDLLRALPDGLVVVGDAVCSFNPTHGQGMTTAIVGATCLGATLQRNESAIGLQFQRSLHRAIEPAWILGVGEDLLHPATVGPPLGAKGRLVNWYVGQVTAHMSDPVLRHAFTEVMHMRKRPSSLMKVELLARLVRGKLQDVLSERRG